MITNVITALIALNCAPTNAQYVGWYDGTSGELQKVGVGALANPGGRKLYSFGVLSDIHIDMSENPDAETLARHAHLRNALTYFTETEPVEFIANTGDCGNRYYDTPFYDDLRGFAAILAEFPSAPKFYPTTGNHDVPTIYNAVSIDMAVWTNIMGVAEWDASESDYSYEVTKTHSGVTDHFLFLGLRRWQNKTAKCFSENDLRWLANKLRAYQRERCFIFTHCFFPEASGNYKNLYNNDLQLGGDPLIALQNLRWKYPQNVWFSGHSHWALEYQCVDGEYNANVDPIADSSDRKAWAIHVPSCGLPRYEGGAHGSDANSYASQGMVVDVYADRIEVRGISFKSADMTGYENKVISRSVYSVPTGGLTRPPRSGVTYVTAADVSADVREGGTALFSVDDVTHDLSVTFTSASQSISVGRNLPANRVITVYNDGVETSVKPNDEAAQVLGIWNGDAGDGYHNEDGTRIKAGQTINGSIRIEARGTYGTKDGALPITMVYRNFGWKIENALGAPRPVGNPDGVNPQPEE